MSPTHPSGTKREADFRKIPNLATWPMCTTPYPARQCAWQALASTGKGASDDTVTVPDAPEQFLRTKYDYLIQIGTPISENRIEKNIYTMLT